MTSNPVTLTAAIEQIYIRALRVLRDEDAAQDFAVEIWRYCIAAKPVRHFSGFVRLRLRKALAKQYGQRKHHELTHGPLPQDERPLQCSVRTAVLDRPFTSWEREVVSMLQMGYSAPEIAKAHNVYPRRIYNTVKRLAKNNSCAGRKKWPHDPPLGM